MRSLRLLFLSTLYLFNTAGTLSAVKNHVTAELVSEVTSVQPGETFWVALRQQMQPHWHTYYKDPGDSGLPTSIEWQLPEGFQAGPIHWPTPKRLEQGSIVSHVYENEVLLMVPLTPPVSLKPDTTLTLRAQANWLECGDTCQPGQAEVSLSLPVKAPPPLTTLVGTPPLNRRAPDGTPKRAAKLALPLLLSQPSIPIEPSGNSFSQLYLAGFCSISCPASFRSSG